MIAGSNVFKFSDVLEEGQNRTFAFPYKISTVIMVLDFFCLHWILYKKSHCILKFDKIWKNVPGSLYILLWYICTSPCICLMFLSSSSLVHVMSISVIFPNYEGALCHRTNFFSVFVCTEITIHNLKLYFFLQFVFSPYGVVVSKTCITPPGRFFLNWRMMLNVFIQDLFFWIHCK